MFWFVVYFGMTYGVVLFVCVASSFLLRKHEIRAVWKLASLAILLFAPLVPYLRVVLQTAAYKTALIPAFRAASTQINGEWETPSIFRVMSVNSSRAVVYSVDSCGTMAPSNHDAGGTLWELKETSQGWKFTGYYDTVWSDCGSAEGNTFPPYPEARSF